MMKTILIILVCHICFMLLSANAQDNCMIYDKILYYLNSTHNRNVNVYETPQNGHDPENPIFIRVKEKSNNALFFYISRQKSKFEESIVKGWFTELLNDTCLRNKEYNKLEDTITQCTFKSRYKFIDYKDFLHFELKDYFHEEHEKETIFFTPTKVTFSEILYSNNIAIGFAHVQVGVGSSDGKYYWFVFKRKKNSWEIRKCIIDQR